MDVNGAHVLDGNCELKGKSSGSKSGKSRRKLDVNGAHLLDGDCELKGKSGKSSKGIKSRRALDLDGEGDLEFDELKLNELDLDGVEIVVFEEDRELNGKSGKSSGSKSGKSRQNLDVNGAHFFNGDCELKGKSSKGSKSRRALELYGKSELKFEEVELDKLDF